MDEDDEPVSIPEIRTDQSRELTPFICRLMQLRKCCNHPYLLPNAESEPFEVAEHLVAASSKLVLLDKLLADILPKGEKVLIFSGFTRMLDILEDHMGLRGYKCKLAMLSPTP